MVFMVFPNPKKSWLTKSKIKMMLIIYIDSNGLIHHEFVPEGKTVNVDVYEGILKLPLQHIWWVQPELYQSGQWNFLHNTRPHTAISVLNFLAQCKVTVLPHPPYSPDLAIANFVFFPQLKLALKGLPFIDVAEVKQCVTTVL